MLRGGRGRATAPAGGLAYPRGRSQLALLDGGGGHVGVELRQEAGNGLVDALIDGVAAPELVRAQLERVLSLDQVRGRPLSLGRPR
jgi:hypothetical protein